MKNLIHKLKTEQMLVTFTKKDGSVRAMLCTQNPDLIPEVTYSTNTGPDHLVCVWDLEKEAWRSFKKDSIISYAEV